MLYCCPASWELHRYEWYSPLHPLVWRIEFLNLFHSSFITTRLLSHTTSSCEEDEFQLAKTLPILYLTDCGNTSATNKQFTASQTLNPNAAQGWQNCFDFPEGSFESLTIVLMRHVPWLNLQPPLHCKIPSIVQPMWCRLSYTCLLLAQGLGPYPRPMQHAPPSSPSWTQSPRILKLIPTKRKRKKSTLSVIMGKKDKNHEKKSIPFRTKNNCIYEVVIRSSLPPSLPSLKESKLWEIFF